jgi:hypothetical protein
MEEFKVKFKKPYAFEGKEYKEVDLAAVENLTTENLINAENTFAITGGTSPTAETTTRYSCILAAIITGHPIEFFNKLPAKEGGKVKNIINNFLYGME